MTRRPSGITSLPMPSPGMTAIRYDFFALLIENVLVIWQFLSCLAANAIRGSVLQWTKPHGSATLQCNVDRSLTYRLTILPTKSAIPPPSRTSNPMDLHLRGKRVLITGASKGIGAAAAEAFAEEGCHLRLAARSGDQLKALAERLRSAHQIDATAHVVDLRKPEDIARLVKDAFDIDILVNNAGDIPGGSIDKIDEATWRHAWELKVFGYINLTRAIYAQMKSRGGGVIVNDIGT